MSFQFGSTDGFAFGIQGVPQLDTDAVKFAPRPGEEEELTVGMESGPQVDTPDTPNTPNAATQATKKESTAQRKKRQLEAAKTDREQLEKRVKEMEQELDELNDRNAELDGICAAHEEEHASLTQKIEQLKSGEEAKRNAERERLLDKRSAALTKQIQDFEKAKREGGQLQGSQLQEGQLQESQLEERELESTQAEKAVQATLEVLRKENTVLLVDVGRVQDQNATLQAKVKLLESNNFKLQEVLQKENTVLKVDVGRVREENATFQAKLKRLESNNFKLQEVLQKENTVLKVDVGRVREENASLQAKVKRLESNITTLQVVGERLKVIEEQEKNAASCIERATAQITTMKRFVERAESRRDEAVKNEQAQKTKAEHLEKELEKARQKNDEEAVKDGLNTDKIGTLQEKITTLEAEVTSLQVRNADLMFHEESQGHYIKRVEMLLVKQENEASNKIGTLQEKITTFEAEVTSLQIRNADLISQEESQGHYIKRVETLLEEQENEASNVAEEKGKYQKALQEANLEMERQTSSMKHKDGTIEELEDRVVRQEAIIQSLGADLKKASKVEEEKKRAEDQLDKANKDNSGIKGLLLNEQATLKAADAQIAILKSSNHQLTETLEEVRSEVTTLKQQVDGLKSNSKEGQAHASPTSEDLEHPVGVRMEETLTPFSPLIEPETDFDPDLGDGRLTLADELELAGAFGELSDDEQESSKPILKDEKKENEKAAGIKTTLEIRYTPFATSSHNPLLCWLFVELNVLVLLSAWVSKLLSKVTSHTHRYGGKPKLVNLTSGLSNTSAPTAPSDEILSVEAGTSTTHGSQPSAPAIPGIQRNHQDRNLTFPMTVADTKTSWPIYRPPVRPWHCILTSPTIFDIPPVKETLYGMAFHLLIYACIGSGIVTYLERQLWLAANDSTRIFLLELLGYSYPSKFCGGIDRLLFAVPENWKRGVVVLIWKSILEEFNPHVNYQMPG